MNDLLPKCRPLNCPQCQEVPESLFLPPAVWTFHMNNSYISEAFHLCPADSMFSDNDYLG